MSRDSERQVSKSVDDPKEWMAENCSKCRRDIEGDKEIGDYWRDI